MRSGAAPGPADAFAAEAGNTRRSSCCSRSGFPSPLEADRTAAPRCTCPPGPGAPRLSSSFSALALQSSQARAVLELLRARGIAPPATYDLDPHSGFDQWLRASPAQWRALGDDQWGTLDPLPLATESCRNPPRDIRPDARARAQWLVRRPRSSPMAATPALPWCPGAMPPPIWCPLGTSTSRLEGQGRGFGRRSVSVQSRASRGRGGRRPHAGRSTRMLACRAWSGCGTGWVRTRERLHGSGVNLVSLRCRPARRWFGPAVPRARSSRGWC
jgi:hypothetical protein